MRHRRFNTLAIYFSVCVFVILILTMSISVSIVFLLSEFHVLDFIKAPKSLIVVLFVISATSIIVGTILAYFISRVPLRPFNTLIKAMDDLSRGDFSTRLDLEYTEEFRRISDSFNKMAKELSQTEILRSDFINHFSHEFKTPIISIKGFTALLKNPDLTDEQRNEYLDIIIEESNRLTDLSTNVLNLTKLENTEILPKFENYNLTEQIRKVLVLLETQWSKKNINLDLDLQEVTIIANQDFIQQALLNLIDNAIKFSYDNGTISIMLLENEKNVSIIVKDEGIGMTIDQSKLIFRKFYQAQNETTTVGNGLGLSLVKRIIELHGGSIFVESAPKEGSTFTISLPKNIKDVSDID